MTTAAAKGGWTRETRFKVVADRWEADLEHEVAHGTMSAGTQRTYLSFLKNHVRPRLDALMMWEVSASICDDLIKDTRNAKGYDSAKTVRTILSAICSLAVRLGAIDVNPVRSTAPPGQGPQRPQGHQGHGPRADRPDAHRPGRLRHRQRARLQRSACR
jgi:hypothetical protein